MASEGVRGTLPWAWFKGGRGRVGRHRDPGPPPVSRWLPSGTSRIPPIGCARLRQARLSDGLTLTWNMYVSMSYTGLHRRNTCFSLLWLRHRNP